MDQQQEFKRFQRDTANHTMEVLRDDGLYRHLKFSDNGSSVYRFDLITWPGHLCISGDMGSNVFSRLVDMFEFFRTDREHGAYINPGYWQEKIVDDGKKEAEEFDADEFRRRIERELAEATQDMGEDEAQDLRNDVNADILYEVDKGEHAAWNAVYGWSDDRLDLTDFHENYSSCRDYTVHFIWRCFAIAWGIQQYDKLKAETNQATQAVA